MNVHAAYLAIITFRSGVTDEDQRARRLSYIVYGLNYVSHARFQSLSAIQSMLPVQCELTMSAMAPFHEDALDTDDETVDPSFDLNSSVRSDSDHLVENFCEDWVCHLDRDDRVCLGLFLCFQPTKHFYLGETKAAELAGMMIGKSDRVVWEWRVHFNENGEIPESKQGKYKRLGK